VDYAYLDLSLTDRPGERWLPIAGYEDRYDVSSHGRVKSLISGIILRQHPAAHGRLKVSLSRGGKAHTRAVHRIVADEFLGECPEGLETCHDDGDYLNNSVANLRFDTSSANSLDQVKHGAHNNASKQYCPAGHQLAGENLYIAPKTGDRHCRACRRTQAREYYLARSA
jgi:hypothetical protein